MGYHVVADDEGLRLVLDDRSLPLGDVSDWSDAIGRAKTWLHDLTQEAGQRGEALATRRRDLGYVDLDAFCVMTGLDPIETFESEAGLMKPKPVHYRILDWLESGELRPRD